MGDFGGEGEEQPCGMLRIVGNGEQLRFLLGGSHGPIAYLNPVGLNQDITQLWGHPYVQEGEKGHFLPIFFF